MRMSVNDIIMWIMAIGFVIGGLGTDGGRPDGPGEEVQRGH